MPEIYHTPKLLPREIQEQCQVYFEEQLYNSALNLLHALVVSGTSTTTSSETFAPPHSQISLLATLLTHPTYTTRASPDQRTISSLSYTVLRHILLILGPVNANLKNAFSFLPLKRSYRRGRANQSDSDEDFDDGMIDSALAREHSLWVRAESFWDVVGWAFNCSVVHKHRWEYWRIWLDYMVDVLEADWAERSRLDAMPTSPEDDTNLKDSIFLGYLEVSGRSHRYRRIVQSIFADGSPEALKTYPEIWVRETVLGDDSNKRKRADTTLDLENDIFGDYSDTDDLSGPPTPAVPVSNDSSQPQADDSASASLGGPESIQLRLRLLSLLSRASYYFPYPLPSIPQLYDLFYETIRPLPLPLFIQFVSPSAITCIPKEMLVSLTQVILVRLLPGSAPDSSQSDDGLTQSVLQRCYLPFAASNSSIEDNAKVAVCIETLLRIYLTSGGEINGIDGFSDILEKGIQAREQRATPSFGGPGRKKGGRGANNSKAEEQRDAALMQESSERCRLLVELLRLKPPAPSGKSSAKA